MIALLGRCSCASDDFKEAQAAEGTGQLYITFNIIFNLILIARYKHRTVECASSTRVGCSLRIDVLCSELNPKSKKIEDRM